jgi:bifunctional non-homologous end joining protein LigD
VRRCVKALNPSARPAYNWTENFHQLAQAAQALSGHDLIIDGEATVFGNTGLPDFQQA